MTAPRIAVVVLAAGSGTRVGGEGNKVLLPLAGLPTLLWSVRTALELTGVHRLVLVVRPEDRPGIEEAIAPHLGSHDLWLVDGGSTRHGSETNALAALRSDIEGGEIDVVAIHDAARPLASADL
ncbi:MAG: 2-C-methyl-D-erythritol 4-phosphate cytidylyltransferase, partial [Marmoricola sp.]